MLDRGKAAGLLYYIVQIQTLWGEEGTSSAPKKHLTLTSHPVSSEDTARAVLS